MPRVRFGGREFDASVVEDGRAASCVSWSASILTKCCRRCAATSTATDFRW
jgi:hypothetical protein